MIEFIPYFAGLITMLFGIAFGYALFKAAPKKDGN
jgi:hypothetical protein